MKERKVSDTDVQQARIFGDTTWQQTSFCSTDTLRFKKTALDSSEEVLANPLHQIGNMVSLICTAEKSRVRPAVRQRVGVGHENGSGRQNILESSKGVMSI